MVGFRHIAAVSALTDVQDTQVAMKAQLAKTSPRFPGLDAKL